MNVPIEHQIVSYDGRPAFVLVPWEEYRERFVSSVEAEDNPSLPWEVGKKIALESKSPIRAWREHLQMSQIEVAEKIGVSRAG